MSPPRRERPLGRADIPVDSPSIEIEDVEPDEEPVGVDDVVVSAPVAAPSSNGQDAGVRRLSEGISSLRVSVGNFKWSERQLLYLAGIVAPLGLVFVLLGWWGASRTPNLFEQVPYLISGGLLGLGLCFLGSMFYFAHWLTELVREHRTQSAAVIDAIRHLEETVVRTAVDHDTPVAAGDVRLVATGKGTMAHRPECVVVVGKPDVRSVTADEGLLPCKLCDPYAEALN